MKKHLSLFLLLFITITFRVNTQSIDFDKYTERINKDFEDYSRQKNREFEEYRDRVNAEFAEYMRQVWPEFEAKPAVPVPEIPEPPRPVIKMPEYDETPVTLPLDIVTPPLPTYIKPTPLVKPMPKDENTPAAPAAFTFDFYGKECAVPLATEHRFRLATVGENDVADAWERLSRNDFKGVIQSCLAHRDKIGLNDWGYVDFLQKMTNNFFPADMENEARLMQLYILAQSGYKIRIGRSGNSLLRLLPSMENLYGYSFISTGGDNFYVLDNSNSSLRMFDRKLPNEQKFSLRFKEQPDLAVKTTMPRTLMSSFGNNHLKVNVIPNLNLIEFYNNFPKSDHWNLYSLASMSDDMKQQLYPTLRLAIEGQEEGIAANILLRFVQKAFDYATDEEQFGEERPLFAEETLFYPYSDCEDRAILFSVLVRELLGLDVVMLYYPGHLATAVAFNDDINGDYITVDNRKFTVCDPTFINSNIGQSMPQYKKTPVQVIKITDN